MRRLRLCALAVLVLGAAWPALASAQTDIAAQLSMAVASALATDTQRPVPHVSMDPTGDTTVEFAILNVDDDASAIRAGAVSDTLAVLRAVYSSSSTHGVRTLTVLGTFPFKGTKSPGVRPSPVLRAVLSSDHAAALDWPNLTASEVPSIVDTWWLQGAFADVDTSTDSPSIDLDTRMAVAVAHLDESLGALDSGDFRIGRSQFTQFFDAWDDVSDDVGQRDPAAYNTIDTDLEQAEVALLHTEPADVATARAALSDLRATLAQVATSLHAN
jgi:hypothetical protein